MRKLSLRGISPHYPVIPSLSQASYETGASLRGESLVAAPPARRPPTASADMPEVHQIRKRFSGSSGKSLDGGRSVATLISSVTPLVTSTHRFVCIGTG